MRKFSVLAIAYSGGALMFCMFLICVKIWGATAVGTYLGDVAADTGWGWLVILSLVSSGVMVAGAQLSGSITDLEVSYRNRIKSQESLLDTYRDAVEIKDERIALQEEKIDALELRCAQLNGGHHAYIYLQEESGAFE